MEETLYKRDKHDHVRFWTIQHDNVSYWTISGIFPNGKAQKTAPTFVEQKNIGKANETSLEEQVIKEVKAKIAYQIDHGFTYEVPDINDKRFEVSLASKYIDRKEKNKLVYPYIYQQKLDGIRCYLKCERGSDEFFGDSFMNISAWSRGHKEFVSVEHLKQDRVITAIFERFPDIILDGELYNHELKSDFNRICSLVKKTKPTQADLDESKEKIYFNCFDCYFKNSPNLTFMQRNERLMSYVDDLYYLKEEVEEESRFRFVTSEGISLFGGLNKFLASDEEVEEQIKEYVDEGFEGIMLKHDVPYFFGRSTDLLKYKFFKDGEYKIVTFEEGKGNLKGIAASVVCVADNGTEFRAGVTGTQDEARQMFIDRDKYVGKLATIKYQELTPVQDGKGGVPRFGKMVTVRDYE